MIRKCEYFGPIKALEASDIRRIGSELSSVLVAVENRLVPVPTSGAFSSPFGQRTKLEAAADPRSTANSSEQKAQVHVVVGLDRPSSLEIDVSVGKARHPRDAGPKDRTG